MVFADLVFEVKRVRGGGHLQPHHRRAADVLTRDQHPLRFRVVLARNSSRPAAGTFAERRSHTKGQKLGIFDLRAGTRLGGDMLGCPVQVSSCSLFAMVRSAVI